MAKICNLQVKSLQIAIWTPLNTIFWKDTCVILREDVGLFLFLLSVWYVTDGKILRTATLSNKHICTQTDTYYIPISIELWQSLSGLNLSLLPILTLHDYMVSFTSSKCSPDRYKSTVVISTWPWLKAWTIILPSYKIKIKFVRKQLLLPGLCCHHFLQVISHSWCQTNSIKAQWHPAHKRR